MPGYITNQELANLLKSSKPTDGKQDIVVVDVRDDDFVGGNIVGCVNSPSSTFLDDVNGLIEKHKDSAKVVFHCALSQQRGPKAARIYEETRALLLASEPEQEVLILRNGFSDFQRLYKNDPELVENWDRERWEEDYF